MGIKFEIDEYTFIVQNKQFLMQSGMREHVVRDLETYWQVYDIFGNNGFWAMVKFLKGVANNEYAIE